MTEKKKPGPEPERLKIEGKFEDAVRKALQPKGPGWRVTNPPVGPYSPRDEIHRYIMALEDQFTRTADTAETDELAAIELAIDEALAWLGVRGAEGEKEA